MSEKMNNFKRKKEIGMVDEESEMNLEEKMKRDEIVGGNGHIKLKGGIWCEN